MSPTTNFFVTFLLGLFGVHKFASGKIAIGFLYLCTGGIFGIGWLYDSVKAFTSMLQYQRHKHDVRNESFEAVGIQYYHENIHALSTENRQYKENADTIIANGKAGKKIFKYYYKEQPTTLVPEPTNELDCNAVMVMMADKKVGYISAGDNLHVLEILTRRKVLSIKSYIHGGIYKTVYSDGAVDNGESYIHIIVDVSYA